MKQESLKAIIATSNFIPLKKGRTYLMLINPEKAGVDMDDVNGIMKLFHKKNIDVLGLAVQNLEGIQIVEVPKENSADGINSTIEK